jgi:hypothetical protein
VWRFALTRGPAAIERMLRMTASHERFLTLPDPAATV